MSTTYVLVAPQQPASWLFNQHLSLPAIGVWLHLVHHSEPFTVEDVNGYHQWINKPGLELVVQDAINELEAKGFIRALSKVGQ